MAAASLSISAFAETDDLCGAVGTLLQEAAASSPIPETATLPGVPACRRSLTLSGGQAIHCAWSFDYRDPAANAWLESLRACMNGNAATVDQPVNHPDTHHLASYRVGSVDVTLSLKDKSARGQSYVFLGVANSE